MRKRAAKFTTTIKMKIMKVVRRRTLIITCCVTTLYELMITKTTDPMVLITLGPILVILDPAPGF
jgi:hypothetical protein